jgi:hypothetical protein
MVHAYINNANEKFEDTKSVNWKTENTMTIRAKRQTMVNKTQKRSLKT